jgi:hypothetical protein
VPKVQFPKRDRRDDVTTLKCAAAHGPRFLTGVMPPKSQRPLPSAGKYATTCFYGRRRPPDRDGFLKSCSSNAS